MRKKIASDLLQRFAVKVFGPFTFLSFWSTLSFSFHISGLEPNKKPSKGIYFDNYVILAGSSGTGILFFVMASCS
jgi:hypothetical protein